METSQEDAIPLDLIITSLETVQEDPTPLDLVITSLVLISLLHLNFTPFKFHSFLSLLRLNNKNTPLEISNKKYLQN